MTNLFVPYEESLKLKELGFDEDCLMQYHVESKDLWFCLNPSVKNNTLITEDSAGGCIAAPLYSQSFKWFRDKDLHADILYYKDGKYLASVVNKEGRCLCEQKVFSIYEECELYLLQQLIEYAG